MSSVEGRSASTASRTVTAVFPPTAPGPSSISSTLRARRARLAEAEPPAVLCYNAAMPPHNRWAGEPITDDDATIAAALEDVSIPTLMLSLVHMTGDASFIRGDLKPQGLFLNEVQGYMSEDDKAEVRRIALDVIRAYRDGGCSLPAPPEPALIREMMSWLVC